MPVCLQNNEQLSQSIPEEVRRTLDPITETKIILQQLIENMPCWYYDKKDLRNTPSIRDGITFDNERRYRKEGARFIMSCGTQMGLGHNTIATGVVYFHRFYMSHSFRSFPRYVTACCSLFLAGKVEETPKKCRDVIKTARALLNDNYFFSFGEDPKEEVMILERILLQTIKFDLQIEHPYTFLLRYAKCIKGDQQKLQKMVQMAWNFVNDSLSTTVCLQWEPEIIAVALIHLASKLSKFVVSDWTGRQPTHSRWWDMFVGDVTMEILEDICHQVLDLYQSNQKEEESVHNSPPQKPPSRADSPKIFIKPRPAPQIAPMPPPYGGHYDVNRMKQPNPSVFVNEMGPVHTIKSISSHHNRQHAPLMSSSMHAPPLPNYYNEGAHLYGQTAPPLPPQHTQMKYGDQPILPPLPSNNHGMSRLEHQPPLPPMPPLPPGGWSNNNQHYPDAPPLPMGPVPNAAPLPSGHGGNYHHNSGYYNAHHHSASTSLNSSSHYHHHQHHRRSQRY